MQISCDNSPRNFKKITRYEKICGIPNSVSILEDFIPIALDMIANKYTGTVNFTNPGVISHNEILQMYKEIVDENFYLEEFYAGGTTRISFSR